MKKILFVCTENACRSQMAEAFFNELSNAARAGSAGTNPSKVVDPKAVEVMKEVGIDISGAKPKSLTLEMLREADKVIIMGCSIGGTCPGAIVEAENWDIEDPAGKSIEKYREVRDYIMEKVKELIKRLGHGKGGKIKW
jgi:arsenate reductase